MESIWYVIKGLLGACGVVACGYFTAGAMCVLYGGMALAELPDWWWGTAAATAAFCGVGVVALLGTLLDAHAERQEKRRMGYVTMKEGKVVYKK